MSATPSFHFEDLVRENIAPQKDILIDDVFEAVADAVFPRNSWSGVDTVKAAKFKADVDYYLWAAPAVQTYVLTYGAADHVELVPWQLATNNVQEVFQEHAGTWKWATAASSSHPDIAMHPSYQRIIGLGPAVLPLIFQDLEETGDPWYWALESITGENPIPEAHYGQTDLMSEDWLKWGRLRHLV